MRDGRDHQPTTEREAFENQWRSYWSEIQDWLDGIASDYGQDFTPKLTPQYPGQVCELEEACLNVGLKWFKCSFPIHSDDDEGVNPDFDQVQISACDDGCWWALTEENLWKLLFFELFQQQDRDRLVRGANWTKPADERQACFLGPDDGICLNCQRRIRRHFGGTEYRCFPNTLGEELELQGGRKSQKASVWIHKEGEAPKKIAEYVDVMFVATREPIEAFELKDRPAVEYAPGVTGPYQVTFNVKTTSSTPFSPTSSEKAFKSDSPSAAQDESRSDVAASCGVPVEWVPENHADMTDEQIVEAVEANMQAASKEQDTTCRCGYPGEGDHDCMRWMKFRKSEGPEISSTCPVSDPTASETPPSS